MIEIPGYDIRFSTLEDGDYLAQWLSTPESCDPFPFGFLEKEEALKNWIGFSKFKASLTGAINDQPIAIGTLFLMPYRKVAHHCSFYLLVDPAHRRKGIGTSMLRNLLNLAKQKFRLESVHVEIYEPSLLLPILEKNNFEPFARQDNFVKIDGCSRTRVLLEHFFV